MTSDAVVPNNRYGTPNHSSAVETAAPPDTNPSAPTKCAGCLASITLDESGEWLDSETGRYCDPDSELKHSPAAPTTADLLAVLKELMAWHDCLPTRNICDIQDDAKRLIAAAEVRS